MIHLNLKIVGKNDPPPYPSGRDFPAAEIDAICVLEGGMQSGRTSVAIVLTLPDGSKVVAQTSARHFITAAAGVRGACQRFGDTHNLPFVPQ